MTETEQQLRDRLHTMYTTTGFYDPTQWANAPAVINDQQLQILGHPVMEAWERPYMQELARIATSRGGRILEIGYGMGLSAGYISQAYGRGVTEHIIVEANRDVAAAARRFAASQIDRLPTSGVHVIEGISYDVIAQYPRLFADGSFDGILHDAYPLDESQVQTQAHFAATAHRLLKPGGVFTYFSDEPTAYRPEHLRMLLDAGFEEERISGYLVSVDPPADCRYWKRDTVLAPIVVKAPADR